VTDDETLTPEQAAFLTRIDRQVNIDRFVWQPVVAVGLVAGAAGFVVTMVRDVSVWWHVAVVALWGALLGVILWRKRLWTGRKAELDAMFADPVRTAVTIDATVDGETRVSGTLTGPVEAFSKQPAPGDTVTLSVGFVEAVITRVDVNFNTREATVHFEDRAHLEAKVTYRGIPQEPVTGS